VLAACALAFASQAIGQTVPQPTQQPKNEPSASAEERSAREDLQRLLDTLRDPAKRDELANHIETLLQVDQQAGPPPEERGLGARILGALSTGFHEISQSVQEVAHGFGDSNRLLRWLETQGSNPLRRALWLSVGKDLAFSIGGGAIVAYLLSFGVRRARQNLAQRADERLFRRIRFAAARLVIEFSPVIAFGLVALGVVGWVGPPEIERLALLAMINATLVSMAGAVTARCLFSPFEPTLRLVPMSDSTAAYLNIWSRRIIVVAVWGYVLLETALLLGLPHSGYLVAAKILGLILMALLVILVLQNREAVAQRIRGRPRAEGGRRIVPGVIRSRLAEIWHVIAILYLVGLYFVWALNIPGGFYYVARATIITLLIISAVAAGEAWLPRLFNRLSGLDAALTVRHPMIAIRANRYIPMLRRGLVYAVRIAAFLMILAAWRVDVDAILFGQAGRDVLGRLADIGIVLVIALVSWEIASGLITAHLNRTDPTGSAVIRSARIRTLLPLVRNALLIVISLMAALIILSEIGVDIAPLLAGAGVVGLAIGFGAQSLVKDVITGAFFMFEGTINIGDVVDLGGKSGLVEGMNIRSIRLRDLNGSVHTINFGTVTTVTNLTREFSYYVIDVKVSYQYDPNAVMEVLRLTDEEMRADPNFKHDILDAIEVLGLDTFADTAFIVRARIRTRPIRQWDVGREFNRRLKHNLEQRGIVQAVQGAPPFVSPLQPPPQAQPAPAPSPPPSQPQPQEAPRRHAGSRKS
jgi:small conductance mechanosensitive channel